MNKHRSTKASTANKPVPICVGFFFCEYASEEDRKKAAGKVHFADFSYRDAIHASAAISAPVSQTAAASMSASMEGSSANERPYSYYGWELGPGLSTFWPEWTVLIGTRGTVGSRKYAEVDPLFGARRSDAKRRVEVTLGNKQWRWKNSYVSLVASLERNNSNIEFYSYRKANVSVVVE